MEKGLAPVDFFDEDDEPAERPSRRNERSVPPPADSPRRGGGGGGRRGGGGSSSGGVHRPANRQQARSRQIAFLIGSIVMLILIVIAIRGCLDARKDRSFQNYVSDLSSITATDAQISEKLFSILGDEGDEAAEEIGLQNEVQSAAGSSQELLDRARDLSAPDEIGGAQEQIVLAFELRHDALSGIAAQLGKTSGDKKGKAETAIYTQMKVLSASDILYSRAQDQIEQVLAEQEITVDEGVPDSQFLPNEPNYLIPDETSAALSGAGVDSGSGSTSNADCQGDGSIHGLGLVDGGVTLQPSGTPLADGVPVTAGADDDSIEVQVQNQGDAEESGVDVTLSGDGVEGSDTIDSIAPGAIETATIPLRGTSGQTAEVTVEAATVPCEEVGENNVLTTSITFG